MPTTDIERRARMRHRVRSVALIDQLGPGLITGAADDDPSGIATYSQAGAQYGYGLLWTMLLTYPLMAAVQLVSAQIGRVTGRGLAHNMGQVFPRYLVLLIVAALFIANTINIGADLAAMGAASELALGANAHVMTVVFALISLGLQIFVPYRRYALLLKWLTLVLFAYAALLFVVPLHLRGIGEGLVIPRIAGVGALTTIVAVLGTTISPYLFFWQSAQEVEEIDEDKKQDPLIKAPGQARYQLRRLRLDTFIGMAFSNLIALAIMIGTAATLHAAGKTTINTAADAAQALEPIAGHFAFLIFSLGIIGTGLLAVPVLAGSAAYAIGESQGWKTGLNEKPWEATGFYAVIGAATLLGIGMDWSPLDPIRLLFWSAVINGVVAAPIMAALMFIVSRRNPMGHFLAPRWLRILGWIATMVMAAAAIAMIVL